MVTGNHARVSCCRGVFATFLMGYRLPRTTVFVGAYAAGLNVTREPVPALTRLSSFWLGSLSPGTVFLLARVFTHGVGAQSNRKLYPLRNVVWGAWWRERSLQELY